MRHFIRKILFNRKKNGISIGTHVRRHADDILHEIRHADSILLHLHPSPDPDSIGSALAMKYALEDMGKRVTVIRGDSEIPKGFMHFPGADSVVSKNIFEVDLNSFDLFIAVDAASVSQVTKKGTIVFPETLRIVNIDHHATNERYGHINLVEPTYPACGQVLYELFLEWRVKMKKEIAENLFIGIYTDTVEFRTPLTSPKTFLIAAKLIEHIPDFNSLIMKMENSERKEHIRFVSLMLDSVETYAQNRIALASVDYETLKKHAIDESDMSGHNVTSLMRVVEEWQVIIMLTEVAPHRVKVSMRSKDVSAYDVSKLAAALGGGGHRAAAGILMRMSLGEAKKTIIAKAQEIFNI